MTHPRRPDDARLSTADLAAASQRSDRTPEEQQQLHQQQLQQQQQQRVSQPTPGAARTPPDREVSVPTRPAGDTRATAHVENERPSPLFAGNESEDFRHRWADIQTAFVDEPRQAVEKADALVAAAIKRLAEVFAHERSTLEQQWARGGDVSTEDLRVALKRYRAFFDRLLNV
jgi:hypothetical protein